MDAKIFQNQNKLCIIILDDYSYKIGVYDIIEDGTYFIELGLELRMSKVNQHFIKGHFDYKNKGVKLTQPIKNVINANELTELYDFLEFYKQMGTQQ